MTTLERILDNIESLKVDNKSLDADSEHAWRLKFINSNFLKIQNLIN